MGNNFRFAWLSVAAAVLAAGSAAAADLPTTKSLPLAPAPVMATVTPSFFVKAGFLYAINQSSSKLYAVGIGQIPGVWGDIQQRRDARLGGRLLCDAERVDRHLRRRSDVGDRQDQGRDYTADWRDCRCLTGL